jgi:hypothetical protein
VAGSTGSFVETMILTENYFITKPTFIKRNNRKILGLYPVEKLARKMTKSKHILQRPPGLTIDAETYDLHLSDKADWTIIFEIDDGSHYWITVPEFNLHKQWINRGQGSQYVIQFKYLHRDDVGKDAIISGIPESMKAIQPQNLQLSMFGGETCPII